MKNNKKELIVLGLLVVMMTVGSIFDFQISSALYNPNNQLAKLVEAFGKLPFYMAFSLVGTIIFVLRDKKNKKLYTLLSLMIVGAYAISFVGIVKDASEVYSSYVLIGLDAIVLIEVCNSIFYRFIKDVDKAKLYRYMWYIIFLTIIQAGAVEVIKHVWSRPRMRLIATVNPIEFQGWWKIGCDVKDTYIAAGMDKDLFRSFPSGHSSSMMQLLYITMLPYVNDKLKDKENIIFVVSMICVFLVGLFRIIAGAHFLTDITVGFGITLVVHLILVAVLKLKK